jgi:hypothetical protein
MKYSLRNTVLISTLFFLTFYELHAQSNAGISCSLNKYRVILGDTSNLSYPDGEYKLGILLQGLSDTLYSISKGSIIKIRKRKDFHIVWVRVDKNYTLIYNGILKFNLKEKDKIAQEQFIGLLPKQKNTCTLWLIIKRKNLILNQTQHVNILKKCSTPTRGK